VTRAAILVEQNWNVVPGGTARSTNSLIDAMRVHTRVQLSGLRLHHSREPTLSLPNGLAVCSVPLPARATVQSWSRTGPPSIDRWVDAELIHAPAYVVPRTSVPLVVTIHDLAFVRHPEWFTPHGVGFFNRFLAQVVSNEAAVIVPSQATADDCVIAGIDESRITTIPWGSDPSVVSDARAESVREKYSLPDEFVLYVGTLEPRKNLAMLAAAMALPQMALPLVVVGPHGWGGVEVGDARTLGELPTADVASLMSAATVLAYPSHFEGFGLPVLEAMAQGTPVVVTAGTAPAEIAGDAGIACDTRSARSIAAAISELASDVTLRAEMGARGRERAASYDWATTAELTADVYEAVL